MNYKDIQEAKAEALRFLERVKEYEVRHSSEEILITGSRESGALKRSSLDLSRSLSRLRRRDAWRDGIHD